MSYFLVLSGKNKPTLLSPSVLLSQLSVSLPQAEDGRLQATWDKHEHPHLEMFEYLGSELSASKQTALVQSQQCSAHLLHLPQIHKKSSQMAMGHIHKALPKSSWWISPLTWSIRSYILAITQSNVLTAPIITGYEQSQRLLLRSTETLWRGVREKRKPPVGKFFLWPTGTTIQVPK